MRLPLLLALFALPALADTPPNLSPATGRPGAASRLIEAHRLYQLGQSAHDPLLIFAAARLMQGLTLREVTRPLAQPLPAPAEPTPAEPTPAPKPKDKKAKEPLPEPLPEPAPQPKTVPDPAKSAPLPGMLDAAAMLAEARALVPDKDLLGEVIADAEAEIAPPGQAVLVTSLVQSPGGFTTFSVPLAGDSYAEIGFLRLSPEKTPDLSTSGHLTMTVTDAVGHPVCVDASASASGLCGIVPKGSGNFRITVTNDGTTPAAYLLITN